MRPRPGLEKGHESGASARDQLTFDDSARSSTPNAGHSPFYVADLPHDRPTSDSAPYEFPSALHFGPEPGTTISPGLGSPQQAGMQPAAAARWQIQPGPTSPLPQDLARSYYSAEPSHPPPQSYSPWVLSESVSEYHSQSTSNRQVPDFQGSFVGQQQGTSDRHVPGVRGPITGRQQVTQSDGEIRRSIPQSGQFEGTLPVGTHLQGPSGLPYGHRQFFLPFEPEYVSTSAAPTRPTQSYTEQIPGLPRQHVLPQTDQAHVSREFHMQEEVQAPKLGVQQVHPEQNTSLLRQPEPHYEYDHQQAPPLQEPVRPVSPPVMTWDPAVGPPPNIAPVSNFPTTTYYPNVWDQPPSHFRSESSSPSQVITTHFTIPPPSRIPDHLLQEKHYVNVLGENQQGETPSPDRAKIKPVFPWEDKPRLTPDRVFPSSDSPPPGQFLLPAVEPASPSPSPSPPLGFFPAQSYTSSQPSGFPPSFSYGNVWDSVPSIQKYASRLVRPPQNVPPLAPAFDFSESRRRESALFRDWHESGESSVEGDDEDTSDEGGRSPPSKQRPRSGSSTSQRKRKEYRSQGVQTIPKETRDQSVQVTVLTDSADADRSIKDKGEGSLSSALAVKQQELSPLGSPTGLRSPRFASPRGSSTNLAESTPRPVLYRPTQRLLTPQRRTELQRLPPTSISRTFSSDTPSSPSSVGPPISPDDTRPVRRAGGRVWDPARGVEIFKRGSEEVLARFLRLGSWEEEKQDQSPT